MEISVRCFFSHFLKKCLSHLKKNYMTSLKKNWKIKKVEKVFGCSQYCFIFWKQTKTLSSSTEEIESFSPAAKYAKLHHLVRNCSYFLRDCTQPKRVWPSACFSGPAFNMEISTPWGPASRISPFLFLAATSSTFKAVLYRRSGEKKERNNASKQKHFGCGAHTSLPAKAETAGNVLSFLIWNRWVWKDILKLFKQTNLKYGNV